MKKTLLLAISAINIAIAQPTLVKDINGTSSASIQSTNDVRVFSAIGKTFFFADDGTTGDEIWVSDGTEANTTLLKDINATKYSKVIEMNGTGYFLAKYHLNDGGQLELWKTDGTTAGTELVKTIGVPTIDYSLKQGYLQAGDNKLYFKGSDATNGTEMWVSDGTTSGTQIVKDLNPGSGDAQIGDVYYVYNDIAYFSYYDGTNMTLYTSDGTESGTVQWTINGMQAAWYDDLNFFVEMNNKLYFQIGEYFMIESDGTESGTKWLFENANLSTDSLVGIITSDIIQPVVMGNEFYFVGTYNYNDSDLSKNRLFKSDGTATGTKMIKDVDAHYTISFAASSDKVFFIGVDASTTGKEIWVTDGTESGTKLLKDVKPGTSNGVTEELIKVGNYICFAASSPYNGKELYQYDIANDITVLVDDIHKGVNSFTLQPKNSNPAYLTELNGTLFMRATDSLSSGELWKYVPYYIADTAGVVAGSPAAPSNLALTPSNRAQDYTKMILTWTDNADNEDGFKVERSTDGSTWTEIADLPTSDTETYTDQGLSANTTYYYKVLAYNSTGSSNYSNQVSASTSSGAVGIDDIQNNEELKVFPNPGNGFVYVNSPINSNITIVNILGELVTGYTQTKQTQKIDLEPGIYFIIRGTNTEKVIVN